MTPFDRAREAMNEIVAEAAKQHSLNQADARLIIERIIGEAILEDRSTREELPTGVENILSQILETTQQKILFEMGIRGDVTSHPLYAMLRIAIRKGFEAGKIAEGEACAQLCEHHNAATAVMAPIIRARSQKPAESNTERKEVVSE